MIKTNFGKTLKIIRSHSAHTDWKNWSLIGFLFFKKIALLLSLETFKITVFCNHYLNVIKCDLEQKLTPSEEKNSFRLKEKVHLI